MRGAFVLCAVFCSSSVALAYSAAPPHSFAKPTSGGKYVLVMLHEFERQADKGLKEKYGRSGLFPVNDSSKPVWTADWRADWERNVFASDDGVFALRVPDGDPGLRAWVLSYEKIPPKKPGWEDAPALILYKNGQPFRTLALRDVFYCSRFTDRDCFMGPIVFIDSFDDAAGRVVLSATADGQKQTAMVAFRTGDVVLGDGRGGSSSGGTSEDSGSEGASGRNWGRVILIGLIVVVACAAVFAGLAVLVIRRQRG